MCRNRRFAVVVQVQTAIMSGMMSPDSQADAKVSSSSSATATDRHARNVRAYRGRHRQQQHHATHEAEALDRLPIPDHPRIPGTPHHVIESDTELREAIDRMRQRDGVAYDTEFIGEASYYPQLCLIQLATTEEVALIDPLAAVDLTPVWELLADPEVRIWVHAGEQDLSPPVRHLGRPAANVLDTQIAAGFCGMAYPVSLAKLTAELVGYRPGKGLTFTDWSQRPLSKRQQHYAADDVRFLPAMGHLLEERLTAAGYLAYAEAETAALCEVQHHTFDPEDATRRVKGMGSLFPGQQVTLRSLVIWRNDAAREADLPPRAFLKDEVLIALARKKKVQLGDLSGIKHMPRPLVSEHGEAILAAHAAGVEAGRDAPPPLPAAEEPTPTERFRASAFHAHFASLCHGKGIDPELIASRQETMALAYAGMAKRPVAEHPILTGWRGEAVGDAVRELLTHL